MLNVLFCLESLIDFYAYINIFLPFNFVKVLIIGGGDGGIAREVCKHSCVKRVVQCEIDEVCSHVIFTRNVLVI